MGDRFFLYYKFGRETVVPLGFHHGKERVMSEKGNGQTLYSRIFGLLHARIRLRV